MGTTSGTPVLQLFLLLMILNVGLGCKGEPEQQQQSTLSAFAIPLKARAFLLETQQTLHQGDFQAALAWVDSAEYYAPDVADVHLMRGRIYSEMLRFEQADSAYKKALSLQPDYAGVWFNLGNNALRRERYKEAVEYFKTAQEHDPSAATLVQIGRAYAGLRDPANEQQAYRQAIESDRSYAPSHALLGQLLEDEGELQTALQHSQHALRLDPNNLDYRYAVGSQLFRVGRIEEALDYLVAVVKHRPWHYGAHHNLGLALVRLGREDQADRHFENAARIREAEMKIQEWEALAELNSDDPARWAALGYAYYQIGRLDEAMHAYNYALFLDPSNVTIRSDLATLYLAQGDAPNAINNYLVALQQDSTLTDVWLNLGVSYARLGRKRQARQAWENVLRYEPNDSTAKAYLSTL